MQRLQKRDGGDIDFGMISSECEMTYLWGVGDDSCEERLEEFQISDRVWVQLEGF